MIMSKIQLIPYVNFQGRAREAMEFYHNVLGGNLDLQTMNQQGVAADGWLRDRFGINWMVSIDKA
jgi:PhnB protein